MKILNRTTRAESLQNYLRKLEIVANNLGVKFTWIQLKTTNWIFHVDIEISLVMEGDNEKIDEFDKLIDKS